MNHQRKVSVQRDELYGGSGSLPVLYPIIYSLVFKKKTDILSQSIINLNEILST